MRSLVTPPKEDSPATVSWAQVDAQLAKKDLLRLAFAPEIEALYESTTQAARAWNIRLTVPLGLLAYLAFSLVDSTVMPDLGSVPTLLRLFLITPVGLYAMWMCSRASAAFREAFISIAITATLLIPLGFIVASRSPYAPYGMLTVILVSMFGNITMRLRFQWACAFSLITVAAVLAVVALRQDVPPGVLGAMVIAALTCVTFGLVANNQLERAERSAFLVTLRETLRAAQLDADKETISALSLSDALTGLPNRRAFDTTFERLWRDWQNDGRRFSLVMIDVDHFKRYNDHYGHPAGDACLRRVGNLLRLTVPRQRDLVARYGGEEFVVLLDGCDLQEALAMARRLCTHVEQAAIDHRHRADGSSVVTVSAGVASTQQLAAGAPRDDLLAVADEGLYAAKRFGRNQAVAHALLEPGPGPTPYTTPAETSR